MKSIETLDLFRPIDLTDERKDELHKLMAASYPLVIAAAKANFNGFPRFRDLRLAFRKQKRLKLTKPQRQALKVLVEHETEIIQGWIKSAVSLCRSFYYAERRPGCTIDDFMQEAVVAIYDCIYSYTGSTEFTTFIYHAVKNKLIDFVRRESKSTGISREMISKRVEVRLTMDKNRCDFESAVEIVRKRIEITDDMKHRLRESMFSVLNETHVLNFGDESQNDYTALAVASSGGDADDLNQMREAIERTPMDEFERDLIETFLREGHGTQTLVASRHTNPRTGKPYTRAWAGQVFHALCQRIQETYQQFEKVAA